MSRPDYRSEAAKAYRHLYKTPAWQTIRLHQLSNEPLCRMCRAKGRITAASVCDHIIPHKGDLSLFFNGPFQSLCKPCHDGDKAFEESRGFSKAIGADGWAVDERHPSNR